MTIKERNNTNKIKTVSLFSGAGGLDIGAIMAGAHIIFANDMMKEACMSYSTNIGDHIVNGDINSVMDRLDGIENVDMVIGGPPCQGFSVAGKMDVNDKSCLKQEREFLLSELKAIVTTCQIGKK